MRPHSPQEYKYLNSTVRVGVGEESEGMELAMLMLRFTVGVGTAEDDA
jgi:hypothetical protein